MIALVTILGALCIVLLLVLIGEIKGMRREHHVLYYRTILRQLEKIMTQITDYVDAVEAKLTAVQSDLASISTQMTAQAASIADLQAQLSAAGKLSPSDQAAMDKLVTDASAVAAQADTAAGNVTPPPAPAPEPVPAPVVDNGQPQ